MAKRKNKGGRPSKFTADTVRKLEWALSIGSSIAEAALFAGISRQTLYEWGRLNPEFSDRIKELQERPALLARKVVIDAIANGDVETSMWYLERKLPNEFGRPKKSKRSSEIDPGSLPVLVEFMGDHPKKLISEKQ